MSLEQTPDAADSPVLVRNCRVDTVVGAILFIIGAVVMSKPGAWALAGPVTARGRATFPSTSA